MRDISKRLDRLEAIFGDGRCVCERNPQGLRFFVSAVQSEVDEALRQFEACPAAHAADDEPYVIFIKTFGDAPSSRTGAAPHSNFTHGNER